MRNCLPNLQEITTSFTPFSTMNNRVATRLYKTWLLICGMICTKLELTCFSFQVNRNYWINTQNQSSTISPYLQLWLSLPQTCKFRVLLSQQELSPCSVLDTITAQKPFNLPKRIHSSITATGDLSPQVISSGQTISQCYGEDYDDQLRLYLGSLTQNQIKRISILHQNTSRENFIAQLCQHFMMRYTFVSTSGER